MKYQDYISDAIKAAYDQAFKYAKEMPLDKLNWKPLDNGRSGLEMLQELAQSPDYVVGMVKGEKSEPGPDAWEKMVAERQAWTTIEKCQEVAHQRLANLTEAIKACPDERLKETMFLPYDGGRDFTIEEIMDYPRWNANYHGGQISYIQTLYGDKEMR